MSGPGDQDTFVTAALRGDATPDDVEDYVAAWHETPESERSLPEALGMLWPEYAMWVEDHEVLKYVVEARRRGLPLPSLLAALSDRDDQARAFQSLVDRYADEWTQVGWTGR